MNRYTFEIYTSVSQLPSNWNALAVNNIFLSSRYLTVLEGSAPKNMECHFIGIFDQEILVGIALSQFIDLNKLESFGERDRCLKTSFRNFILRHLSSHVLFIGNNMLTGQNAFAFAPTIEKKQGIETLQLAAASLRILFQKKGKKVHITTFKDFFLEDLNQFSTPNWDRQYRFSTQPNMIFNVPHEWNTELDYTEALTKKYRDQYKRARKKSLGIEKRKMHLEDIIYYEDPIYDLYFHVAKNAPFNTFFLPRNHFRVFKEQLQDQFLFYGYFLEGKLVGFNTLIRNGDTLDTYFLGYDHTLQRDKMLYLNMLFDMIAYSINKGYQKIVFARTALEIKSSVGAKPHEMYGFMEHYIPILNNQMDWIFKYLEPKTSWEERNPFKNTTI